MDYVNWILVPIDFSADSRFALEVADHQASLWDGGLILMHVRAPAVRTKARLNIENDALKKWGRHVRETPENRVAYVICTGQPVEKILEIAAEYHPRKIVMGRGGDSEQPGHVTEMVGTGFPGTVEAVSATRDDIFVHSYAVSTTASPA